MFQKQIYGGPKIPEMLVAANPDLGATRGVELASISPSFTFIHFHGEVQRPARQQRPQNSFSTTILLKWVLIMLKIFF